MTEKHTDLWKRVGTQNSKAMLLLGSSRICKQSEKTSRNLILFREGKKPAHEFDSALNDKYFISYVVQDLQAPRCRNSIFAESSFQKSDCFPEKENTAFLNIISHNHLCFIPFISRVGWLLKIHLQQA